MKNRLIGISPVRLLVLVLLSNCWHAAAYYDPGVQRWLNRDPVSEPGFARLAALGTSVHRAVVGLNPYALVGNRPSGALDAFGLWEQGIDDPVYGRKLGECIGIAKRRLDEYRDLIRRGEAHEDTDKWFHCVVSCGMTRACGSAAAERIADFHEKIHPGDETDTWLDQRANRTGRSLGSDCKNKKSCEQGCEDAGYEK